MGPRTIFFNPMFLSGVFAIEIPEVGLPVPTDNPENNQDEGAKKRSLQTNRTKQNRMANAKSSAVDEKVAKNIDSPRRGR